MNTQRTRTPPATQNRSNVQVAMLSHEDMHAVRNIGLVLLVLSGLACSLSLVAALLS